MPTPKNWFQLAVGGMLVAAAVDFAAKGQYQLALMNLGVAFANAVLAF